MMNHTSDSTPTLLTVAAAAATAAAGYAYWKLRWRPSLETKHPLPSSDLPLPSGGHWLWGHLGQFGTDFVPSFQRIFVDAADADGRVAYWMGNRPTVSVTHWQDARAVLSVEHHRRINAVARHHADHFVGPKNLLALQGREWKYHRAAVLKAFSPAALQQAEGAMRQILDTVQASVKQRILDESASSSTNRTPDALVVEIEAFTKMITLDIFGLAAFSHHFGCCDTLTVSPIAEAFNTLSMDLARRTDGNPMHPLNYFYSLPTDANRRNREAQNLLRSFLSQAVRERLEQQPQTVGDDERNKNRSKQRMKDLLTHIIEGHEMAKQELQYNDTVSESTLSDTMMSLIFAGYDTTSITLAYALFLISQHPEVEANCLEEIQVCGLMNHHDLLYCKAVIYETLRLYPSAPQTMRTLQKPLELSGGVILPAGTNVVVPIWTIHRQEQNFARPEEFLPERWVKRKEEDTNAFAAATSSSFWVEREADAEVDDNIKDRSRIPAANQKAFFAFSMGGRSCAGQKFAWQEATIVLAGLLKEFCFVPSNDDKFVHGNAYKLHPEKCGPIQHPKGGIPMKISIRGQAAVAPVFSGAQEKTSSG